VLEQPVAVSVTVNEICTRNPGPPQLPDENVIDCPVLEPTIAQPGGLPSADIDQEYVTPVCVVPIV